MRCSICNGLIFPKTDSISFKSKTIGEVLVPNIKHKACSLCREVLISPSESKKIFNYVKEKERNAIGRLPISDFVSLNMAAKILGVSKQAFSKNPRIKAGLIYSVSVGGRKLYNRKSVQQFKETGNGRFLLRRRELDKYEKIKTLELLEKKWISEKKHKLLSFVYDTISESQPVRRSVKSDWRIGEGIEKYARK